MSILQTQPSNLNLLASTGFNFFIKKLPTTNFFCQSITIPGSKLLFTQQPSPFIDINYYGDKMVYNDFTVSFAVDEDLRNYREIYDWIEGLGVPEDFGQRQRINRREQQQEGKKSDITITIANNTKTPNIRVTIQDAFPISISDLIFTTTAKSEQFIMADAVFKYTNINVSKLV